MPEIDNKMICKDCGLVLNKPCLDLKYEFHCPRCDAEIYRFGQNYSLIIIFAITSLILFIPSLFLPLLTLEIASIKQTATLINTVFVFINDGYIILSVFITFIGIFVPCIMLILILCIIIPLQKTTDLHKVSIYFKVYVFLKEWQMSEVYLISILVAVIKLQMVAGLELESGLFFFIASLFCMFVTMVMFNPYDIWRKNESQ